MATKKKGSWFRKTFKSAGCLTCPKRVRKGYCQRMKDGANDSFIYCRSCAEHQGYGERKAKAS